MNNKEELKQIISKVAYLFIEKEATGECVKTVLKGGAITTEVKLCGYRLISTRGSGKILIEKGGFFLNKNCILDARHKTASKPKVVFDLYYKYVKSIK